MWYPKARIDLKMIPDENDVLADDELVVARNFKKKGQNTHVSLYKMNFLVNLSC